MKQRRRREEEVEERGGETYTGTSVTGNYLLSALGSPSCQSSVCQRDQLTSCLEVCVCVCVLGESVCLTGIK